MCLVEIWDTLWYIDEKYEIQRESAWKSELFVTKKGIIEKGFIQKNGIFADEIAVMLVNKNKEKIIQSVMEYAEKKGLSFRIDGFEVK